MSRTGDKVWSWAQCALAVVLAILFLAILLPHTGRVVIENPSTDPTFKIVGRTRGSLRLIGTVLVPLVLIFIGTFRRSCLAILGWVLLLVMLVMAFLK